MAKQKRTNTGAGALGSLLHTIGTVAKVELAGNPEALAEVEKTVADITDSNLITAAELQDDAIADYHEAAEQAEAEQEEQAEEQTEQIDGPPEEADKNDNENK